MTEQEQRNAVIEEAKTWLKTPHHNGARIKGVGVDCGQFPIAVYSACGLMPAIVTERYSAQFHLHKKADGSDPDEWYLKIAQENGRELPPGKLPNRGDFVLYQVGRIFAHGAIVIEWPLIIHSYIHIGVTIDHGNQGWMSALKNGKPRPTKFFTLW